MLNTACKNHGGATDIAIGIIVRSSVWKGTLDGDAKTLWKWGGGQQLSNFVAFKYKASSVLSLHLSLVLPKAEPEMSLWVQVAYLEVVSGSKSEVVGEQDRKGGSVSADPVWTWILMEAAGIPSHGRPSEGPFRIFMTNPSEEQETETFISWFPTLQ